MAPKVQTDERLRALLRLARRRNKLSQERAAALADVTPTWWSQVETAEATTTTLDTLADMCVAVSVRPRHLRERGWDELASMVDDIYRFRADGIDLEDYLAAAPTSERVRTALIECARTLTEPEPYTASAGVSLKDLDRAEPFADKFTPQATRRHKGLCNPLPLTKLPS